ncbi:hypothetical protein GQ44DRAFT_620304 [Phaeosphaeriaceae sp. PMI808]|nr:hypothetical protein GQ44DRAFT_620304 [Phaeosphaeriaceae sp. PMI808]
MSLSCLPTELIETIANCLDLATFRSLRLVSIALKHQSLHVFRDRFFRTRSLAWTKHDLNRILEISVHVYLGSAMRHLIIDATPKQSINLWQLRKRISEVPAVLSEPDSVFLKSDLQEQYIAGEKEAQELTTFFTETRHDQKCLRKVFERLQQLESVVFAYRGMNKTHGKFGRKYCNFSQHEMSRPFLSTMSAIAASGITIKEISIHPSLHYGAVSIGRLESLAPSLTNFDSAFAKLEKLTLNLRDWRYPENGFELESSKAPFVVRFLAKAHNVRHLSLSCYSSLDADLMGDIARTCTFSHLEECSLSHLRFINTMDLYHFITPSISTLKVLKLSHIVLRDLVLTWTDLLRHLACSEDPMPELETLVLSKLFTKTGARLNFGALKTESLALGLRIVTGDWRNGLRAYLDTLREATSGPAWHLSVVAYPFVGMRT